MTEMPDNRHIIDLIYMHKYDNVGFEIVVNDTCVSHVSTLPPRVIGLFDDLKIIR